MSGWVFSSAAEPVADDLLIVDDDDADHSGSLASTRNPPPSPGPTVSLPADRRDPLVHADQAEAGALTGGAGTVVTYAQSERVGVVVQLDLDRRARRVPPSVGQRLLHEPVCGQLDAGRKRRNRPLEHEPHRRPGGARGLEQVAEPVEPGLRLALAGPRCAARRAPAASRSSRRARSRRSPPAARRPPAASPAWSAAPCRPGSRSWRRGGRPRRAARARSAPAPPAPPDRPAPRSTSPRSRRELPTPSAPIPTASSRTVDSAGLPSPSVSSTSTAPSATATRPR